MAQVERAQLLAEIRKHDRELARDMAEVRLRTLRAVAATARSNRQAARSAQNVERIIRGAWRRPPTPGFQDAMRRSLGSRRVAPRGHGRPDAMRHGGHTTTSVHFKLERCASGSHSARHQHYIERDGACVASWGTLAGTLSERQHLWEAISERTRRRRGSLTIAPKAPLRIKQRAVRWLRARHDAGDTEQIPAKYLAKLERIVRTNDSAALAKLNIKILARDSADLADLTAHVRHWADMPPDDEDEPANARSPRSRRRTGTAPARLPEHVRTYQAREPVVQRRLVLELAHELPLQEMEKALREWCKTTLEPAGVGYWATIHQPEAGNDARNWHAHVVFTHYPQALGRRSSAIAGTLVVDDDTHLPDPTPSIRILNGNGPDKVKGKSQMIWQWRSAWCTAQNEALARIGSTRRYDPRTHRARGIATTPAQHHGAAKSRMDDEAAQSVHWSASTPEWQDLVKRWTEHIQSLNADSQTVLRHQAHLERIRICSGLAATGMGPGDPIYDSLARDLDPTRVTGEESSLASLEEALEHTFSERTVPWHDEWRAIEAQGLDIDARAAAAASLAERHGGIERIERWARIATSAPAQSSESNALVAAARQASVRIEPWRHAIARIDQPDIDEEQRDSEALRTVDDSRRAGVDLCALLAAEQWDELHTRAQRARRREAARLDRTRYRRALETAASPDNVARAGAALTTTHREYYFSDAPGEGKALREWIEQCRNAARIRTEFRDACASDTPGALTELATRLDTADPVIRDAIQVLRPEELDYIRAGVQAEDEMRAEHARIQDRAQRVMDQVAPRKSTEHPDPRRLRAALDDVELTTDLARAAPDRLAFLVQLGERLDERENELDQALEALASRPNDIQIAAIAATIDPDLLELRAPDQSEGIRSDAAAWAKAQAKELAQRDDEDEPNHQWRLAHACDSEALLRAMKRLDPALDRRIRDARAAEQRNVEALRNAVAAAEHDLRSDTAAHRKRGRKQLEDVLRNPLQRARLAPGEEDRVRRRLDAHPQPRPHTVI